MSFRSSAVLKTDYTEYRLLINLAKKVCIFLTIYFIIFVRQFFNHCFFLSRDVTAYISFLLLQPLIVIIGILSTKSCRLYTISFTCSESVRILSGYHCKSYYTLLCVSNYYRALVCLARVWSGRFMLLLLAHTSVGQSLTVPSLLCHFGPILDNFLLERFQLFPQTVISSIFLSCKK